MWVITNFVTGVLCSFITPDRFLKRKLCLVCSEVQDCPRTEYSQRYSGNSLAIPRPISYALSNLALISRQVWGRLLWSEARQRARAQVYARLSRNLPGATLAPPLVFMRVIQE